MKTIGLIGGVASGKSLVAKYLAELGAGVLDADRVGHDVLAADPTVQVAIREQWGESVFLADNSVDRSAIASRVFGDTPISIENRRFLEDLLHPRIRERLENERQQFESSNSPAVVLDAPLLLEAGWQSLCDLIIFVDSPQETRLSRAYARGWSDAEFARREASQWPIEEKRRHATIVLANSGTADQLRESVHKIWEQYIAPGYHKPIS
jgi:dephospho-CoA kinase